MDFSLDETQLSKPDSNYWMGSFSKGEPSLIINNTLAHHYYYANTAINYRDNLFINSSMRR